MAQHGENLKKLKIPSCPDGDERGQHYDINTLEEKIVCGYTGYNFDRIENLNIFVYWMYLRDAVIFNHSQSEAGLEHLAECWRMEQTKPDIAALRNKFGKGDKS